MYRHDPQHSANSGSSIDVSTLTMHWNYSTIDGQDSDVCVYNGVVYANNWAGILFALNFTSGVQIWNFTYANCNGPGCSVGSASSPACSNDTVYFGTGSSGSNSNRVFAVNMATGQPLCNFSSANSFTSSPTVYGGVVYIGGGADNQVYALNATNCAKIWNYTLGGAVDSSPAIYNDILYLTDSSGNLTALSISSGNGVRIWNYSIGGTSLETSPVINNNVLYAMGAMLYAFNLSNNYALLWAANVSDSSTSVPTIYQDTLYVGGGSSGKLYAISTANGNTLWNTSTLCSDELCSIGGSPVVSSNGVVFINVMTTNAPEMVFYAFNATSGTQLWSYPLPADSYSEIALVNNCVLVGTGAGNVYLYAFCSGGA